MPLVVAILVIVFLIYIAFWIAIVLGGMFVAFHVIKFIYLAITEPMEERKREEQAELQKLQAEIDYIDRELKK